MGGRDWEHLDVPHLGFASCPSGRREHTVPAVFSAADPVARERHPCSVSSESRNGVEAMVMTPDTRPSRPTRDPETDPRPFFESPSQSRRSDAQPRSRCSLLLVLFPSSLPLPSLRHSWWKRSNFSVQREMFVARRERRERRVGVMVRYIQRKRARLEGRWSRLEPSWTYGLYYGLSRSTRFGASC